MGAEDSWAADTVVLGGQNNESEPDPPDPPRRRGPRRKCSACVVITCATALAVVTALAAMLVDGSGLPRAPIRDVADPAPQVVVKPPTRMCQRELHRAAKPHARHKAKGQLERKREPKMSIATHELDKPEPMTEAVPELEPVSKAGFAPAPSTPTPPAAEFGL